MRTVTCTYHCSPCRRCYHSLEAFDAHHVRDETGWPVCLSPLDLFGRDGVVRLVPLTERGECRAYAEVRHDVTVWTMAASLKRQRERFSTTGERAKAPEGPEAGPRSNRPVYPSHSPSTEGRAAA